jgi:hypothetical protein
MNEFTLLPGESVIKRCDEVSLKGMNLPVGKKDILILTNQYLVCIQRSILGKVKNVERYPLSDIVMTNGAPQVKLGKLNMNSTVDIYLKTGQLRIQMVWDSDAKEWVDAITEVITGVKVERKGFMDDPFFTEGFLKMADNVDKAMGKFRKAFGIKSTAQASGKCPGCGAPISGTEGETVQCPYCGTYYTF